MPKLIQVGQETVEFPDDMSEEQISEAIQNSEELQVLAGKKQALPEGIEPKLIGMETTGPLGYEGVAEVMRTLIPLAGAVATRNPATLAALVGTSDLAASEIEEYFGNPEYTGAMDALKSQAKIVGKAGGSAAMSYWGDKYLLPWMGQHASKLKNATIRPLTKRVLGPRLMPKGGPPLEAITSQKFLGRLHPVEGKPFSLTMDQMHVGQKTTTEELGSLTRSGFFSSSVMRGADLRNIDKTTEFVKSFMNAAHDATPREFGNMVATLVNKETGYLTHKTNKLFEDFRKMVYDKGVEVDLSKAFSFLRDNTDNRFVRSVLSKVVRSDPAVLRSIKGGEEMLLRTHEELEAIFQMMSPAEANALIDSMIHTFPVETAVDLYHNMNRMFAKSKERGIKKFSGDFKKKVDKSLKESMDAVEPAAHAKFLEANAFARKHGELIETNVISEILGKIGKEKPAAVMSMFTGAGGGDAFMALKRVFKESKTLTGADFDQNIRQPVRHWLLSQAVNKDTGVITGSSLGRILDTAEKNNGPEFLREVFGPQMPTVLRESATTLKLIQGTKESNIIIKMLQGAALMGIGGAIGASTGVSIERIAGGAIAVSMLPLVVSRIMSNPRLMRTVTDGFHAGVKSSKFQRALLTLGIVHREALNDMKGMSPEAIEFYSNPWFGEPVERPPEPPLEGVTLLGPSPGMLMPPFET